MKLHCLVEDLQTARVAAEGATAIQLRRKVYRPTDSSPRGGRSGARRERAITFVVNDDVDAALALDADGVHLGRGDRGRETARAAGLLLGLSAASIDEAVDAVTQGASYVGAGPVWATPTKLDADPHRVARPGSGLPSRERSGRRHRGHRRHDAATCIRAGAQGVAVVRASQDARAVRAAVMRLSDLGELGLLAELERRGLAQTIDNDAAQVDGVVVTQDALVEGVHFRLDWLSWRELGFRAAAVNLSDLAASGAEPLGLVVTLAAPSSTHADDVYALYEGMQESGAPVVGGDTTKAPLVVLSVTALGEIGPRPRPRRRAPRRRHRRHRPSRRGGRGVPRRLVRTAAAAPRGGAASCGVRPRDARPLGRPRARRRPPPRRSGVKIVVDLERVPLASGAE